MAVLSGFGTDTFNHLSKYGLDYPLIVHFHAVAFVGYLALFTVQVALIRTARADIHRRLGIAGAALAAIMVVLGPATALVVDAGRFKNHGHPMRNTARTALTVVAGILISFSVSALTPFDYQVVELSGVPYFNKPIHVAIRTREEWLSFTKRRGDWPGPPPSIPGQGITPAPRPPISEIDFGRYSLVVVGIGVTTGYQLALSEIRDMPDEVWVRYAAIRPGTNCAVAQVIGHPSLTILIPRTTKPIRFQETAAAMDCSSFKNDSEMRQLLEKG